MSAVENDLTRAALEYLRVRWDVWCWRNNSGSYQPEGSNRYVVFGLKGSSDILGIVRGTGKLLACEAKTETGKLSPAQEHFLSEIKRRGGVACVIRPSNYTDVIDAALAGQELRQLQEAS